MDIEKHIISIEQKLEMICNALGIGKVPPMRVVEISRKAIHDAEKVKERLNRKFKD
jgi:hypothetical protein